jgi:hypothetical protein
MLNESMEVIRNLGIIGGLWLIGSCQNPRKEKVEKEKVKKQK